MEEQFENLPINHNGTMAVALPFSMFLAALRSTQFFTGGIRNSIIPDIRIVTPANMNPGLYDNVKSQSVPKNIENRRYFKFYNKFCEVNFIYQRQEVPKMMQFLGIKVAIQRHQLICLNLTSLLGLQTSVRRRHQW